VSEKQRRRLAGAATTAGYPGELLSAIAHATLPGYTPGERLTDHGLGQVTDAVELLAEAGLTAQQLRALLTACRTRAPESWRQQFWELVVKAASATAPRARANAG
jgi:hypothetical protein